MVQGIHRYPPMERVIYGIPLEQALADEVARHDARAVYVMASGTLTRETDMVDTVRHVLGNRLAGLCPDRRAHAAHRCRRRGERGARRRADLLVTLGGGSVTDAAKMVGLCLGNDVATPDDLDRFKATITADGKTERPPATRRRCARSTSRRRCRPASTPPWPAAPIRCGTSRKATAIR